MITGPSKPLLSVKIRIKKSYNKHKKNMSLTFKIFNYIIKLTQKRK